jgi:hypothetical protein
MTQITDFILYQTVNGEPVRVGDSVVTPQAQVLALKLLAGPAGGGFVWNRPVALLVERHGETRRYPIVDVTRLVQISLLAAVLVTGLLAGLLRWRSSP